MKIKYKFFIACVLTLFLIMAGINRVFFSPAPNSLERKYSENSREIITICEYLNGEQFKTYETVRIDIFDSITKVECSKKNDLNGGYVNTDYTITDSNLVDCLEIIRNHGFLRIMKEYNYMYFQIKSSFNESIGLIYSPKTEPNLSEINAKKQILKRLKNDGWYYNKTIYD